MSNYTNFQAETFDKVTVESGVSSKTCWICIPCYILYCPLAIILAQQQSATNVKTEHSVSAKTWIVLVHCYDFECLQVYTTTISTHGLGQVQPELVTWSTNRLFNQRRPRFSIPTCSPAERTHTQPYHSMWPALVD